MQQVEQDRERPSHASVTELVIRNLLIKLFLLIIIDLVDVAENVIINGKTRSIFILLVKIKNPKETTQGELHFPIGAGSIDLSWLTLSHMLLYGREYMQLN